MENFRASVLLALFVGTASYGLVFSTCALDPKGSCSILGFNSVPPANHVGVANGDKPDDPPDSGYWSPIF